MISKSNEKFTRVAVVDKDKCKPNKCNHECKLYCPVVKIGKECVIIDEKHASIIENNCLSSCGICVKKCPFGAITVTNIPKNLEKDTTFRYGVNSFKLHRLPSPREGNILGIVGSNGVGKSTVLKLLSNKLKLNFGLFGENQPSNSDVIKYYRGNSLQHFFTNLYSESTFKSVLKPQFVDSIPKIVSGTVLELLTKNDTKGNVEELLEKLELSHIQNREISKLSGGELQRFAIAMTFIQEAFVYLLDEPTSYLDIRQRLKMAQVIREQTTDKIYTIVVEHDLSILDYLSDSVCILYGQPNVYGIVSLPYSVRDGINVFMSGYIPAENMRFRDHSLDFNICTTIEDDDSHKKMFSYPTFEKKFDSSFHLTVEQGVYNNSQITVLLAENGMGKTTFMRLLCGLETSDSEQVPKLNIAYKPQKIAPTSKGTVYSLLQSKIPHNINDTIFINTILKPLHILELYDQLVSTLSGGELQRVAIALVLGINADVYLIDEPSTYLDSEQRLIVAKIIKHFIMTNKKTAFIIEHDFMVATYLADSVIVFSGQPGISATAHTPQPLHTGMNQFLSQIGVTFRRDITTKRPRINKLHSQNDKDQKLSGKFFNK